MKDVNIFYTTCRKDQEPKEHELRELQDTQWVGMGIVFGTRDGRTVETPKTERKTNQTDYDKLFRSKLVKTQPPYQIEPILDFHFEKFIEKEPQKADLFIDHMEFVIGVMIGALANNSHHKVLFRWIEKKRKILAPVDAPMQVTVGNNSIVQLQHNSQHSTQHLENNQDIEQFRELLKKIDANLRAINKELSQEQQENLSLEKQSLELQLNKKAPDVGIIRLIGKNVLEIIKAVPANLIANIITNQIQ